MEGGMFVSFFPGFSRLKGWDSLVLGGWRDGGRDVSAHSVYISRISGVGVGLRIFACCFWGIITRSWDGAGVCYPCFVTWGIRGLLWGIPLIYLIFLTDFRLNHGENGGNDTYSVSQAG